MSGPTPIQTQLASTLTHLGAAHDRVRPSSRKKAHPRDPSSVTVALSAENLSAVIEALESEAYVLRRADAVANTAGAVLSSADDRLTENDELAQQFFQGPPLDPELISEMRLRVRDNRAAVVRMIRSAAFSGTPLFDGKMSLRVGGGQLQLPDLTRSLPTLTALRILQNQVQDFQQHVVAGRLQVVEATLLSTAQTRSMTLDDQGATEAARSARTRTLQQANGQPDHLLYPPHRGSLLDILG